MVDFSKLGSRVGEKGYSPIREEWSELPTKKRDIIRALIKHPEKRQGEIAKIADCDSSHVHKVIHSLEPEQFNRYKGESVEDVEVGIDPNSLDVDENDLITVKAPMTMEVSVSIPRTDLERATKVAMSKDAVITGIEGRTD